MLLYSKRYEHEDTEKNIPPEELIPAFGEAYSRLSFHYLPEREEEKAAFIDAVKIFSQKYSYDVEITEEKPCIEARVRLDHQYNLGDFTRLIGMSDDITIFQGIGEDEFIVSLLYYTHAVLRGGVQVIPLTAK